MIDSPLDDILANAVQRHHPVHLMKSRSVGHLKHLKLPYHLHTSHRAYAHEPGATIQIDDHVDLFHRWKANSKKNKQTVRNGRNQTESPTS